MPAWLLVFHGTVSLETAELRQMGDTVYATFVACIGLEELSEGIAGCGLTQPEGIKYWWETEAAASVS